MNKFFLVTLMIILSVGLVACQSSAIAQVTVTFTPTPTETPIPKPTLHPEFIELQSILAQTERFTLPSVEDGILYDGSPIVGLEVGRDGTILLDVGDDQIVIEQSQIHFDDKEGVTIDGYDLDEDGTWVEAISPAEAQLNVDMERWGIDLEGEGKEKFEMSTGVDGKITLTEKESGRVVYIDGSWEPLFLGEMIKASEGGCKVTPFISSRIGATTPPDIRNFVDQYKQSLVDSYLLFVKNRVIPTSGMIVQDYNMGKGCWGGVFYRQKGVEQPMAWYFWKDAMGRVKYDMVFVDVAK